GIRYDLVTGVQTCALPIWLRAFYQELFGWEFDTSGSVAPSVSQAGNYGFTEPGGDPIPGGVGGGPGYRPHTVFYVGVPDVGAARSEERRVGKEWQAGRAAE